MKGGTLFFGIVTVFILLAVGIAMYTLGSFQTLWGNFDLIGAAGLFILYILLGRDQSLQPKRVDMNR